MQKIGQKQKLPLYQNSGGCGCGKKAAHSIIREAPVKNIKSPKMI